MKLNLRPVIASAAVLVITGGVLAATVGTAAASTTPPWEPDSANEVGSVTFYNAAGDVVTSGTSLTHLFDYVQANSGDVNTGAKATVEFGLPEHGVNPAIWPVGTASTSVVTPPTASGTPADLATSTTPVGSSLGSNANLANFISGNSPDTTAGYDNIYQVRLVTQGGGGGSNSTAQYWAGDVLVNPSDNSWTQVFPAVLQGTTTTLSAAPSPATAGQTVTLSATEAETGVTPAAVAAGTIQFMDGSTPINSPVAVNSTTGAASTTTTTLSTATHNLSAVFTPTDPTTFGGSTGTTSLVVNPVAPASTTTLAVTQDGVVGDDVSLSATVTTGSPATPVTTGTVSFFDNNSSTPLNSTGVTPDSSGVATFDIPAGLAAGGHSIVAKFSPANVVTLAASQSAAQTFTLQAKAVGACAQPGSVCTDPQTITATIPVGTLVINTPYTSTNPLDLGTLALNSTATGYSASAPFGNIVITDNRSGGLGWTASALAGPLSDGGSNPGSTINGENVGLTNLADVTSAGDTAAIAVTSNPAASPAVAPGDTGSQGLGGTSPHAFATSTVATGQNGEGTTTLAGTLTLNAPTSTEAGLFTGTVTFTVG